RQHYACQYIMIWHFSEWHGILCTIHFIAHQSCLFYSNLLIELIEGVGVDGWRIPRMPIWYWDWRGGQIFLMLVVYIDLEKIGGG
ncbi:hypothetical protein ACJX0J_020057, partial [Zea mays]